MYQEPRELPPDDTDLAQAALPYGLIRPREVGRFIPWSEAGQRALARQTGAQKTKKHVGWEVREGKVVSRPPPPPRKARLPDGSGGMEELESGNEADDAARAEEEEGEGHEEQSRN